MGLQSKNIDNLFKDELGSYAETPPPMAWDALEKRLDKIPPRGALFNPGKAMYLVMITSLLMLSVSVAKKMYVDHMAYLSQGIALNIATSNQLTDKRPVSEAVSEPTGNSKNEITENKQNSTKATNNTSDNPITKEKNNPRYKNNTPLYKKMSTVKAFKNSEYAANDRIKNQDRGVDNNKDIAANVSLKELNAAISTDAAIEPPAENTIKDEETDANKPVPATVKPQNANKANNQLNAKPKLSMPLFIRFEAGIKAGYETGFNTTTGNKLTISPYIQYNLTPKFAVMVQPAIKSGIIHTQSIGSPKSFYKANNDSLAIATGPAAPVYWEGTSNILFYLTPYAYSQSHDSIIKSFSAGGAYTEYELPLLIKYNIVKQLSVYGGVNLEYSKSISIKENTNPIKVAGVPFDTSVINYPGQPVNPPPVNSVIKFQGTEISNYKYPFQPTPSSSFRAGYMVGFSYEYQKRWLLDGLMEQTPAAANMHGGYNINRALSSTYFRFTLGYKLIK